MDRFGRALATARALAARGEDDAAKQAYVALLHADPTHLDALNELASLAAASGHRSAARTAYLQAIECHPNNTAARVNLGNLLLEDCDYPAARAHFGSALAVDPNLPEAHQGMARALSELGDEAGAAPHWRLGFEGRALVARPYRGIGEGVPLLLLVSARGGNIPTRHWIDDRHFAITAIFAEYFDASTPLPPHALVVNAIGDADLCGEALARAQEIVARTKAPVVNSPARVRATGREANARRLGGIAGVIAPKTMLLAKADFSAAGEKLGFPLLLRAPGYHTGRHFVLAGDRAALARAAADMPGETVLAIQYLDARGADGMARKYRVMCIGGALFPLHLACSDDWKVHYFTSAMAERPDHREEERGFLDDMPGVLGARAMAALGDIFATMGLDYAGVDFALAADGSPLLFEANATMVVFPPDPDPIWDYRRPAVAAVLHAAARMLERR